MDTEQLYTLFNTPARIKALQHFISDKKNGTLHIDGLQGSATALLFSSLLSSNRHFILVANDLEEAGYLYHDLVQIK